MKGNDRSGRSVRVGVWLLGLALVPLTGAGWFALGEVREVNETRRQIAAVQRSAGDLVELTVLQSALLDEGVYASIVEGMTALGVEPEVAAEVLGIDVRKELADTRARVDAEVERLGLRSVGRQVAALRQPQGLSAIEMSRRYDDVTGGIDRDSDGILERLVVTAGDSEDGGTLVTRLHALELSAVARRAVTDQFLGHFGVRYSEPADAAAALQVLIGSTATYDEAIEGLRREETTSEPVRRVLRSIESGAPYETLRDTVEADIRSALAGAVNPDPSMETILLDLDAVATDFHAGATSAAQHLDLVVAAGDGVAAAASDLDRAADARTRRAAISIAVLVLTTVAFALAVSATIGRPLSRLADSVRRLSTGDHSGKLRPTGPTEIRQATQALNEAAENLSWAERQARALATGDLDDPVLSERAPGAFGASLQEAVTTLAGSLADREEFRRRLSHEASHDSLTQVANRRAVMAQLERSLARTKRSSSTLAVMFIDLDGFKAVNDLEGHPVGDAVLGAVARRLVTSVRKGDQVGRVGGDEFLVVAEPVTGAEEALALARRVRTAIAAPIETRDVSVSVDASIGIAIVDADCDLSADELLRDADLAVYKAKATGRGQIVVCDEELRTELEQRADLEHALRAAIAHDELVVHYQPIVDPGSSEVIALEALVRWDRPGTGLVPPDTFIPHAERSELIVDLDRWVLDAVARQMREWCDHEVLGAIPVAVNVSARHLGRADFVSGVLDRLAAHDIDCRRLIVEVTESVVVHDLDHAGWALQTLRGHGVRVAIDDFGTGYTSLAHLRALPIDILKIDRSFTSDPNAASLVQLIIDTGHLLGARITSEGIETDEQATALRAMGSDELQGFLFGRPLPAGQLELSALRPRVVDSSEPS